MISADNIRTTLARQLPEHEGLLRDLMAIPSVSGAEQDAMAFLEAAAARLGVSVERVALSDDLLEDPEYSDPVPGLRYDGRFNLRLRRAGTGGGPTLLVNAHVDVVPPSEGMTAWSPEVRNRVVYGRGACDAKGQIAAVLLALSALDALQASLAGDIVVHLVVEEENGGNGTLAMVRRGERADACVVVEPSDGRLYTSVRGAVWFRLTLRGRAGHSGTAGETRSALLLARDAMAILEEYHAHLLRSSRGIELFDPYPNPMPLTFGRIEAGNWPASAPSRATLEGVLGLLPNKSRHEVCEEVRRTLMDRADGFRPEEFDLHFTYRHDSSVLDPGHELPRTLLRSGQSVGRPLTVAGMTASCDAWFYNNLLHIPTVVYGPGSLRSAHSAEEHLALDDLADAAAVLTHFAMAYCASPGDAP